MAGLFIGSLIVDALVPIVGLAIKHHNDEKHKHHKTPQASPSGGGANGGDDMDTDDDAFETPFLTPDVIMNVVNKRSPTPIETPKPKRLDKQEKRDRDVDFTGPSYTAGWCRDFSAIQRTRVNPVTGRIIGYKGCLLYTSPSPRDMRRSRMPSSA